MSQARIPAERRTAIWRGHRNKCSYCRKLIQWGELEIDHILPQRLVEQLQASPASMKRYGLDSSFDFNGYGNLLPAHRACNREKGGTLYEPGRAMYYLERAKSHAERVRRLEEMFCLQTSKDKILAKVSLAVEKGVLTFEEIKAAVSESGGFALSDALEFSDDDAVNKITLSEVDRLLDKPVLLGQTKTIDGVEFQNDFGESVLIRTCREYRTAKRKGYYSGTNFAIKMEAFLQRVDAVLHAVSRARIAAVSFIRTPYLGVADLDYLPATLLPMIGPAEDYPQVDLNAPSLGSLAGEGRIKLLGVSSRSVRFEWEGGGSSIQELIRADLNGDGVEEILADHAIYALGGSLCVSEIVLLSRVSGDGGFECRKWPDGCCY